MIKLKELKPEYIINKNGEKTSVILSIKDFEELIEDIEDLAAVAERINESTIPHDELISELKRDGLI